jgi:phosphoglycerate dehydrogenase-like enzyme
MRVAILDDYQNVALQSADWDRVREQAELEVFSDHLEDEAMLAARLGGFDAIVLMRERTPFRRSLFSQLPKLRLLVTTGMGNAAIDLAAAADAGVTVCGTRGLNYPTAELTWGLILALFRRIPQEDTETRAGRWQTTIGEGLQGKTLGVLGLGRLGSQVATIGLAFGMDVMAWSQNLTTERATEIGAELAPSIEALLERADIVSVHLVLSDRTRGLLGAAQLARMKQNAYLVNTSRGPIVEEGALIDALKSRSIAGAGLDVFDREPLPPRHPLLGLDNVVLTPHIGYVTKETYEVFYADAIEDLAGFLDGAPVRVIAPSPGSE